MTAATMTVRGMCSWCRSVQGDLIRPLPDTKPTRWVCRERDGCNARHDALTGPVGPSAPVDPPEDERNMRDAVAGYRSAHGLDPNDLGLAPGARLTEPDPISGRSEPRVDPGPPHRLTFHDLEATWDGDRVVFSAFTAICLDEVWTRTFQAGHSPEDLGRLVAQHNGIPDEVTP